MRFWLLTLLQNSKSSTTVQYSCIPTCSHSSSLTRAWNVAKTSSPCTSRPQVIWIVCSSFMAKPSSSTSHTTSCRWRSRLVSPCSKYSTLTLPAGFRPTKAANTCFRRWMFCASPRSGQTTFQIASRRFWHSYGRRAPEDAASTACHSRPLSAMLVWPLSTTTPKISSSTRHKITSSRYNGGIALGYTTILLVS